MPQAMNMAVAVRAVIWLGQSIAAGMVYATSFVLKSFLPLRICSTKARPGR